MFDAALKWPMIIALVMWSPIATGLVARFFPELLSKLLLGRIEHRNQKDLERYKDELGRSASRGLEEVKGEIADGRQR